MFNTTIPLYGIFIIIALLSGIIVVYKNSKTLNIKNERIIGLLIYITIGAVFGAKYFTFFINYSKYNGVFDFTRVGLSSYGAVLGMLVLLFLYSKQYKIRFKNLIFILLPSIPLMYGVGKIGCFLAGCCYGIEYNGPLSVTYNYSLIAPNGVSLFPIQLLESIIFIGISICTQIIINKNTPNIIIIGKIFLMCGFAKFLLDYLRMNHIGKLFTTNQLISLVFVLIGLILIFVQVIINKKSHN